MTEKNESGREAIYQKIAMEIGAPDRFVRISEAVKLTSFSNSQLWQMEQAGSFPKRIRVGRRSSGYRLSDIMSWLADPVVFSEKGDE